MKESNLFLHIPILDPSKAHLTTAFENGETATEGIGNKFAFYYFIFVFLCQWFRVCLIVIYIYNFHSSCYTNNIKHFLEKFYGTNKKWSRKTEQYYNNRGMLFGSSFFVGMYNWCCKMLLSKTKEKNWKNN